MIENDLHSMKVSNGTTPNQLNIYSANKMVEKINPKIVSLLRKL